MAVHNGRLYVLNGAIRGEGSVLEAQNPAGGNDNFRWITPQDMYVFEIASFNGYLYLGVANDFLTGYSVVKLDTSGAFPYTFLPVVTNGGYVKTLPSNAVASLHVFQNRLYVGTNIPAELIRINPDDSWDLIVGRARQAPDGWKLPLSGFDSGFDWPFNVHMWRMQEHNGALYVGTLDQSTRLRDIPGMQEQLGHGFGFDLYSTIDGIHFEPITTTGFGDPLQIGLRTFASTPIGLFSGGVSYWQGLRLWRGTKSTYHLFLPKIRNTQSEGTAASSAGLSAPWMPAQSRSGFLTSPVRLEAESKHGMTVLSWERAVGAARYLVFRANYVPNRELGVPGFAADVLFPSDYTQIGATDQLYFVDDTVQVDHVYRYYITAENSAGALSSSSNMIRVPSLAPPVTFTSIERDIESWSRTGEQVSASAITEIARQLDEIRASLLSSNDDVDETIRRLEQLRQGVAQDPTMALQPWRTVDFELLLAKRARRVWLLKMNALLPTDLK
jgi:hypothetical protein